MRSVVAGIGALVVVLGLGAADRVVLRRELDEARRDVRRLEQQVPSAASEDEATRARLERVEADLVRVRSDLDDVQDATKAVCADNAVERERARLEGANAGSEYRSDAFYTTLLNVIDTICGVPRAER